MINRVTSTYEHALATAYHKIDKRGILFDERHMAELRSKIQAKVDLWLDELSNNWGTRVYLGAENKGKAGANEINLNSPDQLLAFLTKQGFQLPKVRKKNKETHDISYEESVEELVLRKVFAATNDSNIKRVLDVREFNTLKKRYIDSRRYNGVFYCIYGVASTISGRRGSSKHIFGYGGNAQTFPKHYDLSEEFRKGVISRPGKLFFMVDQMSAEDWPVSALAENMAALAELKTRADRHSKLAAYLFNKQVSDITKDGIERYLGKKTRHASNYRMKGQTMSDSLAKEGIAKSKEMCDGLLEKMHQFDPNIRNVFHKYIDAQIYRTYMLINPFGREVHFHGLRGGPGDAPILSEASAIIPQSTVADNTGFAVLMLDGETDSVINECHDSINQEIPDTETDVRAAYVRTQRAFERDIRFHNGITVQIPIEAELAYNLVDTIKVKDFTEENCVKAWKQLREQYKNAAVA